MNNFNQITPVSDESVSEPASKMEFCDDGEMEFWDDEEISRVIYPLANDIKSIALYEKMSHPRSTVGNDGLLIRFLYAMDMNYKVAVVVPSKRWGNKIKKLVPSNKNVVRFDGKKKNIEEDMSSTDVLIYTCGFSAGYPVYIKNHFHCVFVVVDSPVIEKNNGNEMSKTPDLRELSELARQIRYPITPNVYVTITEGIHGRKKPAKITTSVYMELDVDDLLRFEKHSPCISVGTSSEHEFAFILYRWFISIVFPGSTINDEIIET
ncbi:hypothetical protein AbHV_ORF26 [Abalone herpesvirus Victoria/AUS/2009]|uniref:Uncharacterized protein n=2 Tax=Aurivirus haliotidmalaco1 TaxID=3050290 RepID=K4JV29_ABHV|nr:hypothetical protein AbHV_ORF26 [Abalone herpesvirus Victoria/AUS/2009]ADP36931.1 p113c [Abalone herpesvirus Victoria/AUS/2007]AFU90036.1 hypothetical protein AbHV_ORF26 [Abalone herpesvirus Victoria/AUS/2009]